MKYGKLQNLNHFGLNIKKLKKKKVGECSCELICRRVSRALSRAARRLWRAIAGR